VKDVATLAELLPEFGGADGEDPTLFHEHINLVREMLQVVREGERTASRIAVGAQVAARFKTDARDWFEMEREGVKHKDGGIDLKLFADKFWEYYAGPARRTQWMKLLTSSGLKKDEAPRALAARMRNLTKLCGVNESDLVQHYIAALGEYAVFAGSLDKFDAVVAAVQLAWERKRMAAATMTQEKLQVTAVVGAGRRARDGCWHCGVEGHLQRDCPKIRCFKCGGRGHMAANCKKQPKKAEKEEDVANKGDIYSASAGGRGRLGLFCPANCEASFLRVTRQGLGRS